MKWMVVCAALGVCTLAYGDGLIGAKVGGSVAPDGKTEIQIDLPASFHKHNISSRGLGCCVFRSIDHAARWCDEPALFGMPEWMLSKGIAGGGYPEKAAKLIKQIAKERGLPEPQILQVEGGDIEIMKAMTKNGLMVCGTYGVSATGRYNGQLIDHMVNYVHCDDQAYAVLDNNYVTDSGGVGHYEWLTPAEAKRALTIRGGGWVLCILKPPPPLPPRN